jgi:high-affinity Fe2+/Pb2+ permease
MSRSSPRLSLLIAAVVTAAVAVVTTWAVYRFVIAP